MSTFQELILMIREYQRADEAMDDEGVFRMAMEIREAASRLVLEAAQNLPPLLDHRRLETRSRQ